jgi:hypothetical protein
VVVVVVDDDGCHCIRRAKASRFYDHYVVNDIDVQTIRQLPRNGYEWQCMETRFRKDGID